MPVKSHQSSPQRDMLGALKPCESSADLEIYSVMAREVTCVASLGLPGERSLLQKVPNFVVVEGCMGVWARILGMIVSHADALEVPPNRSHPP